MRVKPAARAHSTALVTLAGSWVRPSDASTCGPHRLDAERQPVDAGRRVGVELGAIDRVGIALDGDLGAGCARDRVEDARELRRVEQRRRPPAEEHARGGGKQASLDVDHARVDVVTDQVCTIGPRREVAVVAPGRAERHVDVHAELVASHNRAILARRRVSPRRGGRRAACVRLARSRPRARPVRAVPTRPPGGRP